MRYVALSLLVVLSCGRGPEKGAGTPPAPPVPDPRLDRPFVVFRQPSLLIDRLESPVPPPVTVGSQPSPSTMASDAPDVVSVDPNGALVAHRAGTAVVRPIGSGETTLVVEVRPVSVIAIEPPRVSLPLGGMAVMRVASGSGEVVPARSVQWLTTDPSVAWVDAGTLRAGNRPGKARVVARYGGQEAVAEVSIGLKAGTSKESPRLGGAR